MLVIVSDLHLNDGTAGSTISSGAFQLLAERLGDMALRASHRADGSYRPIERIDLLLLGDVLDVIRSRRWLEHSVRPWDDPQSPEMHQRVTLITADILSHNEAGLAVLHSLAAEGAVRLPPANRMSRPAITDDGQAVEVQIHYMVGNHDWFYHVPGAAYDGLRQTIVDAMGLANRADMPFAHDPRESNTLLEMMRRHKVLARHGDIFDPLNFDGDRDTSSLGDAMVIELLSRFSAHVETQLGADLPVATILGLREIDNIRPRLLVPVWIDGLLERTCPQPSMRKDIKRIWDSLADEFLQLPFVRARDTWSPVDMVDGLERALKFSRRLSVGWASRIAQWLYELRGAASGSYYQHAIAEQDFRNRRAKHIVYGHTHHAETVPLDASYAEGYVLNQVYFNSGTWRRVHEPAQMSPGEHEFIATDAMTYLAFYQGDEREGRPYETWTGALSINPSDVMTHRIDPAAVRATPEKPIPTPGLHPHFAPQSTPVTRSHLPRD